MRKKNAGLGRGLDAIFLENSLENTTAGGENVITILKLSMEGTCRRTLSLLSGLPSWYSTSFSSRGS